MSLEDRRQALHRVQEARNSKVVAYVMADRLTTPPIPGMSTRLAAEPQLQLADHLNSLGRVENLDLFLYTRGGDTNSVWPLVNMCREFCEKFALLVPFRAHSAGTLIGLGADEIVMGPFGELSPIDPETTNPFNPVFENDPSKRKPISVEDVASYMELARDKEYVGLEREEHILEVFRGLSHHVHPLALGNVFRTLRQTRLLARKLLELHMDAERDKERIDTIIDTLTVELYSHHHVIGREESLSFMGEGFVKIPSEEEEQAMSDLFEHYAKAFKLRTRFNLLEFLGDEVEREIVVIGAYIESESLAHVFRCKSILSAKSQLPPNVQVQAPPGQPIPRVPGFPLSMTVQPVWQGWEPNEGGD